MRDCRVSIHAPARGATYTIVWISALKAFQSTRPRGARLRIIAHTLALSIVSIHAPARGATQRPTMQVHFGLCFNPRARVGRDLRVRMSSVKTCWRFNPRARVGRDRMPITLHERQPSFNPRARVGRDVSLQQTDRRSVKRFQSTRPRGARHNWWYILAIRVRFQSTRPRGARLRRVKLKRQLPARFNPRARVGRDREYAARLLRRLARFNPRARVGRDAEQMRAIVETAEVSIHAPAWGATPDRPVTLQGVTLVSIHAPAWGATCMPARLTVALLVSIHAPAWGATLRVDAIGNAHRFQSTRPRGARRDNNGWNNNGCKFQSTRPRGARLDKWPTQARV